MEAVKWLATFPVFRYGIQFTHDFIAALIRTGPVPNHIAFVMDGNRRFAKKNNLEAGEGHYAGFEAFVKVLHTCSNLGVKTVTVYAFSIENFNRKQEEADLLFNLIRTDVWNLVKDRTSTANEAGWRVKVWGDRSLLEPDIIERIERIEEITITNNNMVVNICCPYTSRDDMAQAMRANVRKVEDGEGSPSDITQKAYERSLYVGRTEPLDILVRTSGETRLSDFMCYESVEECEIEFVKTLWPEYSAWEVYWLVSKWGYKQAERASRASFSPEDLPSAPPVVSVSDSRNRN